MAEALAVVGAVASTIQLMDFTAKVFERLNDYIQFGSAFPKELSQQAGENFVKRHGLPKIAIEERNANSSITF
ncbi:uncharacterized protein N7458_003668 [Penicillium daleae]|uniref:Uncharacterized protein n=1 Tax=Penicillium daleae TaxID=63821 RepID=A0AAD6CFW8_9EURO|nr:uncharacterized protein N7458_003668 [Penicillium daleae]KAJ5462116.1 hypothetical protein N7458_003668 [Penicillium daleae]